MSTKKASLVGLSRHELRQVVEGLGEKAFRGDQIHNWLYSHAAQTFGDMKNLPASLVESLTHGHQVTPLLVASHKTSIDGVDKLLVHSGDDQVFECVLLPYEDRVSCCLSSQIGCPMACTFCATGLGGFERNLGVDEIVGQYLLLQSISARRISHVVFMGMGEPLLNLDNLIASMKVLTEEVGLSYRHITVSTVGLVPKIDALAEHNIPIHLALSLHSPIDEIRSKLMPVNLKWPVKEVLASMQRYQQRTRRKITIEYLLIDGVNDSVDEARLLGTLLKGFSVVVNLIPFNWVDTGHGFKRPKRSSVARFRAALEESGVPVTERVERGHDIAAACGQLAGQHAGRFGRRRSLTSIPVT